MPSFPLHVNGQMLRVDVDDPDMPLLYALRDILKLRGPRFGCGLAQCGACTVHIDEQPARSCVTPLSSVGAGEIVTLEGLGTPEQPHPSDAGMNPGGVLNDTAIPYRCATSARSCGGLRPRPDPRAAVAVGPGLAFVHYELSRTYVAGVAQVEVTRSTGQVRVRRVFVAHDCGQIINPDGTRNQIEGNVIQTVSRVLKERVIFDRRNVTSLDWSSYPILTFPEVPDVVVDLIDRPDMAPLGVGEPSSAIMPAAVANAIHDAVGIRMRSVPFTPEKVRAALQRT